MDSTSKIANKKAIRSYTIFLKEAEGLSEKTISSKEHILAKYEEFIHGKDFRSHVKENAIRFKKYLMNLTKKDGRSISSQSLRNYLYTIKNFYIFLYREPEYKRQIKENDIQYFSPERGLVNATNTTRNIKLVPSYQDVEKLIMSIPKNDEHGLQELGMESLLAMTGVRLDTLISLQINSFHREEMILILDTTRNIRTKGQKSFMIKLIVFEDNILNAFLEYYSFLRLEKNFCQSDPLFPKMKVLNGKGTYTFVADGLSREFYKSYGSIEKRHLKRCVEAGIKGFSPHIYRDIIIQHARKYCRNLDEYAAVSQNIGHSSMTTTDINYGQINPNRRFEIMDSINFKANNSKDGTPLVTSEDKIKVLEEIIRNLKSTDEK